MLKVKCPNPGCGKVLSASEELLGKKAKCPACGMAFLMPSQQMPASRPQLQVYRQWPFDATEARRRQEDTARALGAGVERDIDLGQGVKLTLVLIPPGTFMMGSESSMFDRGPIHRVIIARPFYIGKYPVTQAQWQVATGSNRSSFSAPNNPVERVSWHECQQFIAKLASTVGPGSFSLPAEAEWEYACRAGTATEFSFGNDEAMLDEYAWHAGNSGGKAHPVGAKMPNAWGLHDLHGNVWEWCEDVWHDNYQGAPADGSAWLTGGYYGSRVLRGGSWSPLYVYPYIASCCRTAFRLGNDPRSELDSYGCRVVLRDF